MTPRTLPWALLGVLLAGPVASSTCRGADSVSKRAAEARQSSSGSPLRERGAAPADGNKAAKRSERVPASDLGQEQDPVAPVGMTAKDGYRLLKNWDFAKLIRDEAALRAEFFTRYVYANGSLDHLNDEWSRYRDKANHSFTPKGLALVARPGARLAPGQIESGMLRSRWSGQYGVYEIRMRVPSGRGLWPAFWLNPEDQRWPPEIDVVEIVDNGRDTTKKSFHFLHGGGVERQEPIFSKLDRYGAYSSDVDYSQGFHVFSIEWSPGRVRHMVDGVTVVERSFEWKHDDGTDAGPAHVLVNLAVGGKWPGPPHDPKAFPAKLEIAHIRVWQK